MVSWKMHIYWFQDEIMLQQKMNISYMCMPVSAAQVPKREQELESSRNVAIRIWRPHFVHYGEFYTCG